MTRLVFHHDHNQLPPADNDILPVQIYGNSGQCRGDISVIGNSIVEKIQRLGLPIPGQVMDLLTVALAVTAADTFVQRKDAADGWARQFFLQLPLHEPDRWISLKEDLEKALHFLSGDIWCFEFQEGGFAPPVPFGSRYKRVNLREVDCVSLFSGGLDSAIGAIDLLEANRKPLLVSHGYTFDKGKQVSVASQLKGQFERFSFNADPHVAVGEHDVTMRTRSFNFLAFAAIGAYSVHAVSQQETVDLFIPENGFISLNAPLTSRRIGSLSTRTTHPFFIESIQKILDALKIPCCIKNPYQFKTKGQMTSGCRNQALLRNIIDSTVSCSHWKRKNKQCGICVPCIIRRASLKAGNVKEEMNYRFNDLTKVLKDENHRDDLMALRIAIAQRATRRAGAWLLDSGPLPHEHFLNFQKVFLQGLDEVEDFLRTEEIL